MTTHVTHPELALDRIGTAFARVLDEGLVQVDGNRINGLNDRLYPLAELCDRLLAPATPASLIDAVWRYFIAQARTAPDWQLICIGAALPSLRRIAARIIATSALDPADVNSEVLCGALEAIKTMDLDEGRAFPRLRAAAAAAGMRLARSDRLAAAVREQFAVSTAPPPPASHPDLVLARAVAGYVITPGEADLIGATRLENTPLAEIATVAGVPVMAVFQRRWRAERRLVAWILGRWPLPDVVPRTCR